MPIDERRRRRAARGRARWAANQLPYEARTLKRILVKVEPDLNGGCWLYAGRLNQSGYGVTMVRRKHKLAHRVLYSLLVGALLPEEHLLHLCDVRCCVNPAHLRIGSQLENIADMLTKGRHAVGRQQPAAKLSDETVRAIRADPRTLKAIAAEYGVTVMIISRVKRGLNWKHV